MGENIGGEKITLDKHLAFLLQEVHVFLLLLVDDDLSCCVCKTSGRGMFFG